MNASPAPAASPRSREPTDAPAAEETLAAHARRALRTRVRTRITAVLDAGIGFLQRLRTKAGGEPEKADDADDRRGARPDRAEARRGASAAPAETPVEAPKPKRRLHALLIYVSVLLVGGAGGGVLAYTLFQQQLDQVLNDSLRQEAARSKKTRPSADIQKAFDNEQTQRADAEKKLAASLAAYSAATSDAHRQLESLIGEQVAENRRLQAALADSTQSSAETHKALTEEQAKRTAAEEKLAESSKAMAEKQKQLDAAEKQLAALNVAEASPGARRDLLASRSPRDEPRSRPLKTGNCTLGTNNVNALKNCIADFNR
ncbi:hypothetical protein [Thiobacillus sp.]|uniref:hypothetical protein n=1 Tax=Thiobacillus sp. TaxID=924 RepID=UPI0025D1E3B1|nr:hypothetical protein [Thiobacillus sp.]